MENERSIIGALCLDPDEAAEALSLEPSDFTGQHRTIFRAAVDLHRRGVKPDLVSLTNELQKTGTLAEIGGADYLSELVGFSFTTANIGYYVKQVREKSQRRKLGGLSESISRNYESMAVDELLEKIEGVVDNIRGKKTDGPQNIGVALTRAMKNIEHRSNHKDEIPGIETGLPELDKILGGLQKDRLYIIAGRPGMGKSALALDMARNAAKAGKTVLLFSLEMGNDECGERALSSEGRINNARLRFGRLNDGDWPRLHDAAAELHKTEFFLDDSPIMTADDIRSRSKQIKRKHDLGLVVVDYLQLIGGKGSRYEIVTEASRQLKLLAKEIGAPVVALCQLNRSLESREDKRPKMADLRESGALEQDADVVMFCYRESVYCECKGVTECEKNHKTKAVIIISKHRGGPCGIVNCQYIGEHTTFVEE